MNPLRLEKVPGIDDMSSVIDVLKNGQYFITTSEVLIPFFEIKGEGENVNIVAEVEWTFPLDFIENVSGDGQNVERKKISATELLPFGKKRFEIPFNTTGQRWVRFAAWDVATNGAMVQPVWLERR